MPRAKKKPVKKKADRSIGTIDQVAPVRVEPLAPQMKVGHRLSVDKIVGEGGLSNIEQGFDSNLLRSVARKVIKRESAEDESMLGRLIEEAQITAQLDHPNIVPVYELGVDDSGELYFTMKLIRGRTFNEILGEVEPEQHTAKMLFDHLQILLKVCDAMAFAHSRGVIHQDLKPDNVMVGEFGEVYLMDWGFARLKRGARPSSSDREPVASRKRRRYTVEQADGKISATIYYMAPEQALADPDVIDERTDIFCLGGILYKILTGRPPYFGETMNEVARKAIAAQITPPEQLTSFDLPPRLCRICLKALAADPKQRYQTVAELKQDVESFLLCGWQFDRKRFAPGELVVREGEHGDEAYIVTTGRCRVFRDVDGKRIDLGEIGVGDVFGELAVFADQPRSATVEAIEPVTAMVVTRRHFEEDLGMSFWLGLFVKTLAQRFLACSDRLIDLERALEAKGSR